MSMFLKPFFEQLLDLSVNGVDFMKLGSTVNSPVFPFVCSVDSVAKPKVLCMKHFNGKPASLYCFYPNDTRNSSDKLHKFYDTSVKCDLRKEESVVSNMLKADGLQRNNQLKNNSVN